MAVNGVLGQLDAATLGPTLMHEHLVARLAGREADLIRPDASRQEIIAICVDRIEELKAAGFRSMLDPCPIDLGRDVELAREVAYRTGFNIIVATGLYTAAFGAAHWRGQYLFNPEDFVHRLADMFISEIIEGVGATGIKAGVIKLSTSAGAITDYERAVFEAGAIAAIATGTPITTHTDAVLGNEQVSILINAGVAAHRIIVGHCCGNPDHGYHRTITDAGAYVGFDRFGDLFVQSDEVRLVSLLKLWREGQLRHVIVSHDSLACGLGFPPGVSTHSPLHFSRVIAPQLTAAGVSGAELEMLLIENPRRYFEGMQMQTKSAGLTGPAPAS